MIGTATTAIETTDAATIVTIGGTTADARVPETAEIETGALPHPLALHPQKLKPLPPLHPSKMTS